MLKQLRALKIIGVIGILWIATMLVFAVTPIASDDTYTMNPNTDLVVAAPGVLTNDTGFNSATHRIESYDRISQYGFPVTLLADGSFTYQPDPGFRGIDTFQYTVRTDEGGSTALVTIELVGVLYWFVDDSATPGGDGTYSRPFNSMSPLNNSLSDVDGPGDGIFVYAGNYAQNFLLEQGQQLIGEATGLTLVESGITIAPGTAPVFQNGGAGFPAVSLANNTTVNGINFTSNNGPAIQGNTFASATLTNIDITLATGSTGGVELLTPSGTIALNDVDITGTSSTGGAALSFVSNSATINLTGSTVSAFSGGRLLNVSTNAGTITFDNASDISGTGNEGIQISTQTATGVVTLAGVNFSANVNGSDALLLLNNNANSVVNFEEGMNVTATGTNSNAFVAVGGRVKIVGTGSTLSAADGGGLELSSVQLTQNATFASISSTSSTGDGITISSPVGNNDIIVTGATTITSAGDAGVDISAGAGSGFQLTLNTLTSTSSGNGINVTNATLAILDGASTLTSTNGIAVNTNTALLDIGLTTATATNGNYGINLNNTSGTLLISGGTLASVAGASFHTINIINSSVAMTHGGTINKTNTGRLINIDGLTNPGFVTLSGSATGTNASSGVSIINSTRPVTFGGLNLGTAGARFTTTPITLATNSGTVNLGDVDIYTDGAVALNISYTSGYGQVSSTAGSLLSANGNVAALVVNPTGGTQPLGLVFNSITNSGAGAFGIDINNASGTLSTSGTATFGAKTTAAIEITNSSLAASFREIDITGAAIGVTLTSNTGSFTITGDGTAANVDGAGGTITNTTTHAFNLNTITNLTINDLQINNVDNHGISGQAVNGLTIDNLDMVLAGDADNEHAMNFKDGAGANLVGTVLITDSTFTTFAENGMYLENFSGTLNMTIQNTLFNETDAHTYCGGFGCDSHGLLIRADGNANMTIMVDNVTFDDMTQVGIDAARENTATLNITVQNSLFDPTPYTGTSINDTDNALRFFGISGSSGTFTFLIQNNVMGDTADGDDTDGDDFRGTAGIILVRGGGPGTTLVGRILNNTVTDSRLSNGIAVESNGALAGTSTTRVRVENNVIRNHFNHGINVLANSSISASDNHLLDVALMNNSLATGPSGSGVFPINMSGGDYNRICGRITGNYGVTPGTPPVLGTAVNRMRIRHVSTPGQGQIQLETLTPFTAGNDGSASAAVSADNNGATPISFTTSNAVTPANCTADSL
ncbi:MAG: Ig-like domain-containing protein [Anaerolineae bacterium]|jgi:hypothetical protein|nr:Ig-like domain-containing protein [Anaerolineae bacterium]